MPAEPATIELERFLPYRLSVLSNIVSGAIAAAYRKPFDLTIPEWRVLAVLARDPARREALADLARVRTLLRTSAAEPRPPENSDRLQWLPRRGDPCWR